MWAQHRVKFIVAFAVLFLTLGLLSYSCKPKPAQIANEYRIGCMLPLSEGPAHQYAVWAQQGINLATEEINQKGGIGGKKLVIDYQDDMGSGDEAVKIMSKFTSVDKYPLVFAYVSQPSSAIAPIARDSKTVLITNTYQPGITQANEYVYRVGHNAGTDSRVMGQFLKKQFGDRSLAILYVKTPAGDKATEILEQTYKDLGGRVAGAISYATDEKDFRSLLLKIKSLKPQIIYIYPYKEVGTIIREIRRLEINSVLATNNTVEQPNFLKDAGEAAEGVVFTTPLFNPESSDPVVASYFDNFKKKYNLRSEVSAATWYDTVKIVALAIERGGYSAEGIRQSLLQIKNYPGVTGVVTFREDRDVDKPVVVKVVRNGQFVPWDAK